MTPLTATIVITEDLAAHTVDVRLKFSRIVYDEEMANPSPTLKCADLMLAAIYKAKTAGEQETVTE